MHIFISVSLQLTMIRLPASSLRISKAPVLTLTSRRISVAPNGRRNFSNGLVEMVQKRSTSYSKTLSHPMGTRPLMTEKSFVEQVPPFSWGRFAVTAVRCIPRSFAQK